MKRLPAWVTGPGARLQDLALALALAVYNVASLIPETRQLQLPYVAFLLVVLQALPLIWRRRWPVAVFVAVGIPRTFYDQLGWSFNPLPLGSAIAYYTIMDRSSTRVRTVISAVLIVGIFRSQTLPGHAEPYDFFVAALQFAVAGTRGHPRPDPPRLPAGRRGPGGAGRGRTGLPGRAGRRRGAGPGSPANCTTWWRITSASWRSSPKPPPRCCPVGPPMQARRWTSSDKRPGRP